MMILKIFNLFGLLIIILGSICIFSGCCRQTPSEIPEEPTESLRLPTEGEVENLTPENELSQKIEEMGQSVEELKQLNAFSQNFNEDLDLVENFKN